MLANLLDSLDLPPGARVAVQAEKSVESLLLYLAVLRAGFVYLPLNIAYKSDEVAYFIGNAAPSVFVCAPKDFAWLSALAFDAGTTLRVQRSATTAAAACSNARRHFSDRHAPVRARPGRPRRHPLHQRHDRAAARARC